MFIEYIFKYIFIYIYMYSIYIFFINAPKKCAYKLQMQLFFTNGIICSFYCRPIRRNNLRKKAASFNNIKNINKRNISNFSFINLLLNVIVQ